MSGWVRELLFEPPVQSRADYGKTDFGGGALNSNKLPERIILCGSRSISSDESKRVIRQ